VISPTTQTVVGLRFALVSDREPPIDRPSEDDEGLISRFWKSPTVPPAPPVPVAGDDGDAEAD
jgi:hypothetical protein